MSLSFDNNLLFWTTRSGPKLGVVCSLQDALNKSLRAQGQQGANLVLVGRQQGPTVKWIPNIYLNLNLVPSNAGQVLCMLGNDFWCSCIIVRMETEIEREFNGLYEPYRARNRFW